MLTATYTLPEHWAPYLFYGDGIENGAETELIDKFMEDNCLLPVLSCTDEAEFCHRHDATDYGILACMCLDYTFPVKEHA